MHTCCCICYWCCTCHCHGNWMLYYKYGVTFLHTGSLTTDEWYVDWHSMAHVCLIDRNEAVVHVCWVQSTNKASWGQQWGVYYCLFFRAFKKDGLRGRSMWHCLHRCCCTCFVVIKDRPCGQNQSIANKNTTTQRNAIIMNVRKPTHRRNVNSIDVCKCGRHVYRQ